MKLPGIEQATVDEAKVRDYLLSFLHPIGRSKARFFARLGFHEERWQELQKSLLLLPEREDATPGAKNEFGQKYIVRGIIKGPTGREAMVETIWIVLNGDDIPRLVTAYPGDSE